MLYSNPVFNNVLKNKNVKKICLFISLYTDCKYLREQFSAIFGIVLGLGVFNSVSK